MIMADIQLRMAHHHHLLAFAYGAAIPELGESGCGFTLFDDLGVRIAAQGFFLGAASDEAAGYEAVIHAANAGLDIEATTFKLYCNSKAVVGQMLRREPVPNDELSRLRDEATRLLRRFTRWQLAWVPQEGCNGADVMAIDAAALERDIDYSERTILRPDPRTLERLAGSKSLDEPPHWQQKRDRRKSRKQAGFPGKRQNSAGKHERSLVQWEQENRGDADGVTRWRRSNP